MKPNRIADLSVLLEETPEAYYWIGFLMADGHFYKRGAIKLHLAEKDRDHINKFREFVKYSGKANSCTMNAMNPLIVHAIMDKFKITNRKTFEPCDISNINGELMFSLIVGMLDGDGNVRWRNKTISTFEIKIHRSWLNNLKIIEKFLYSFLKITRINIGELSRISKSGYARMILSDRYLLASIKKLTIELKLPTMSRKWDGIDLTYVSPYKEYRERCPKILEMVRNKIAYKDIAKKLNISCAVVATTIYRERKKYENMDNC